MDPERERRIREAIEEAVARLVEAQVAGDPFGDDRALERVLAVVREHDARLLQPPPQVFAALALPQEFDQALYVPVLVPATGDREFVVTLQVILADARWYEDWRARLFQAEPARGDAEQVALLKRVEVLVDEARERRRAEAAAVPALPAEPAAPADDDEDAGVARVAERWAAGNERVREAIEGLAAPSVRLLPDDPSRFRSRFGGVPFLPPGTEWPRRGFGRPLHFLAQLDLREVPRTPLTDVLPAEGTLAFFFDATSMPRGIEETDADGFAVRFVPASEALERLAPPPDTTDDFVRPVAGIRFDLDATFDPYEFVLDRADQDALAVRIDDDHTPRHRLLGEPEAIQGDPREEVTAYAPPGEWRMLLQIDAGEPLGFEFGDSGRVYFLVSRADLERGRWDRVWLQLQCY